MCLILFVEFPSDGITIHQLSPSSQVWLNLKGLTLWFYLQINKSSCSLNTLILRNNHHQFSTDNFIKYEDLAS